MRLIVHTIVVGKDGAGTTVSLYHHDRDNPYEIMVVSENSRGSSIHNLFVDALIHYTSVIRELTRDEEW